MWTNFPSCRKRYVLTCTFLLFVIQISGGQYFDPDLDDKTYLDNLQKKIESEVKTTREELIVQAQIVELMTKQFVAAQLKENLFIALRVLAEKELSQLDHEKTNANLLLAMANQGAETTEVSVSTNETTVLSPSVKLIARQDDDDDDDNGGAGGAGGATTVRASDTAQFQQGLIPQVANLIKAIFGGNQNINLTNYVTGATKLLPKPVGSQVVGLVNTLSVPSNQNPAAANKIPPGAPGYRPPGQQYPPGYNPNINQVPGTAGYRPNQIPAIPGASGFRPNNVAPGTPGFRPNQVQGQGVPGYRPNQIQGGNYPVNQGPGIQQNQGQVGPGSYRPGGNPSTGIRPNPIQGGRITPNQVPGSSQLSEYKPNQIATANNGRPNAATRPYQINQANKVPGVNGIQNNLQNFQQQPQLQPGQIGNGNRLPPSNANNANNQIPDTGSFSNTFNSVPQLGTSRTTIKPYIYNPNVNKGTTRPGFQASVPQYQINQQYLQQQQIQQQQQFQQSQFQQAFPSQQQFQQPQNQFVPQQQFSQQQFPQQQQQQQPQQPIRQQPGGQFEGSRPNLPNPIGGGNRRPTEEDEDEDEDEDGRKRQFNIGQILNILKPTQAAKVIPQPQYVNAAAAPGCANNLPTTYAATTSTGTVTGSALQQQGQVGVGQVVPIQAGPIQVTSQVVPTQTGVSGSQSLGTCLADPSDVSSIMMAQGFNLGTFANDVGKSFRDIIRVMPDIFRGAREGVQLLQTLSSVLGGLDGFSLGDIF